MIATLMEAMSADVVCNVLLATNRAAESMMPYNKKLLKIVKRKQRKVRPDSAHNHYIVCVICLIDLKLHSTCAR